MNNFATYLANRYNGTIAERELCEAYLRTEETLLFGIEMCDPKANFNLLSDADLECFSEPLRNHMIESHSSIFARILLIFYCLPDGKVSFKIVNGMASKVFPELLELCKDIQSMSDN